MAGAGKTLQDIRYLCPSQGAAVMLDQGISKGAVQSQPPKLLLQPILRKAVDKEEKCNKWVTPVTRHKTIYSNLELHCWSNLHDEETPNKTSLLFSWINPAEQKTSTESLILLYIDPGKGQHSTKLRKSLLRASLDICPFPFQWGKSSERNLESLRWIRTHPECLYAGQCSAEEADDVLGWECREVGGCVPLEAWGWWVASRLGVDGISELPWEQQCQVTEHGRDEQEQEMCRSRVSLVQPAAGRKAAPADAEELSGDRTLLPALAETVQMLWPSHVLTAPCLSFPSCKLLQGCFVAEHSPYSQSKQSSLDRWSQGI